ncbi:MAG: 50S ribosomal protein L30 [Myxococcales bacterium]|nr:50S ribosomal protein L30 [Myxococcales bacterium]|tara:strand:+ start:199 stop:381 length:183 start_codon:yes stop_codon:yes gene_type:complete
MSDRLQVKLVRSRAKANTHQRKVLDGLGLKKRDQVRDLEDTASVRGMINKVNHLVQLVEK